MTAASIAIDSPSAPDLIAHVLAGDRLAFELRVRLRWRALRSDHARGHV